MSSKKLLQEMPRYSLYKPEDPDDVQLAPRKKLKINTGLFWPGINDVKDLIKNFRYLYLPAEVDADSALASFVSIKKPEDEIVYVVLDDLPVYIMANPRERAELGRMAVASSMEEAKKSPSILNEEMSFRQLMNFSTPERVVRSLTVHGPPLNIRAFEDSMYYLFNFKSNPSTTGLRHKGYIKFIKPRNKKPLMDVHCVVDCTCPDFRYRWAWADKQRRASKVGTNSMNQALNLPPKITNPSARPGLCKHILALRNWIDNSLDVLTSEHTDDGSALTRLVAYAQHRKDNEKEIMTAAKSRRYDQVLAMLRKRNGEPGPLDKAAGQTPEAGGPEDKESPESQAEPSAEPAEVETPSPASEPPLVAPVDSPNPLDFHGRLPPSREGSPEEPDEKDRKRTVDSLETNTNMNLIEAQKLIKEMMDASPAAQPQLGTTNSANGNGPNCAPGQGGDGEVSAESEALNLLRNINAGIQELVPAIQAISQSGGLGLEGPGEMDGIEFPEPGEEGEEGAEGEEGEFPEELDASDRFNTGGEDRGGEFGDLGGEEEGSASREAFGKGKGSKGREASSSREREAKRNKLSVSGKED